MNVVIAGRCNWCSRQVSPADLFNLSTGQAMCWRCHDWHGHALAILGGAMPRGCQFCGLTLEDLNALTGGTTTRMYVVPVDGIYTVACLTCKEDYCRKRADLYRGTKFGQDMKL
jgi:hypothetical protein